MDTQDTSYQMNGPLPLDNGQIYAVAGTLGTETGNATYVGFGINQLSIARGVANLSNEDLRGTAKAYAREVNYTHKFYFYYFTRDCSGLKDLTDGNCFPLTEDLIPLGDRLMITILDYIKPGTQRGPDSSKVLPSRVLKLQAVESEAMEISRKGYCLSRPDSHCLQRISKPPGGDFDG